MRDLVQILAMPTPLRRAVAALAFGQRADRRHIDELQPLGLADGHRLTRDGLLFAAELLLTGWAVEPELLAAARQLFARISAGLDGTCRGARRIAADLLPPRRASCAAKVHWKMRPRLNRRCVAASPARCLTDEDLALFLGWPMRQITRMMILTAHQRTGAHATTATLNGCSRRHVYNVLAGNPRGKPTRVRLSNQDLDALEEGDQ